MRLLFLLSLLGCTSFGLTSSAIAAELIGRAVLPARTFAPGITSGRLVQQDSTLEGFLPLKQQQPVQGVSAVLPGSRPGTFLVLADNGFGAKDNSADFLLRFYAVEPDFLTDRGGSGQVFPVDVRTGKRLTRFSDQSFVQLNDSQEQIKFPIVADSSSYPSHVPQNSPGILVDSEVRKKRLLTGADFDLESFRRTQDGTYWLGDEFGPFLLQVAANGELLTAPIPLPDFSVQGEGLLQSPDYPTGGDPRSLENPQPPQVSRSKGFEGMALNPSETKLYVMLEGPLNRDRQRNLLKIYEFDLTRQRYIPRTISYRMEGTMEQGYAIGDLTAINDHEFLVIERDSKQGDPNQSAFENPAQFKRVYKIDLRKVNRAGFVPKELVVDLLNIADPAGIGGNDTSNGRFTFPFLTIESVLPLNPTTLLIINDNNYPFSKGRTPDQPDNTEFVLIRLEKPLNLDRRLTVPGFNLNS